MSQTHQFEPIQADRPAPPPPPEGGEPDFAALLDRYEEPLLRYVARVLGGQHADAQDVVQEAFLRLHRQATRKGLDGIASLTTWLYRVAHNLAIDAIRRRRSRPQTVAGERVRMELENRANDESNPLGSLGELGQKEAREQAMAELDLLPENQRNAITLKVLEGMTMREIGQVLGMAPSNVCYHMNQGLSELSRRLKRKGVV